MRSNDLHRNASVRRKVRTARVTAASGLQRNGKLARAVGWHGCYCLAVLAHPKTILRRRLTLLDHRIRDLPVLVLMPHSACNCRCVMCDIWKANANKQTLSEDALAPHLDELRQLGVAWVVLSGGEALMHPNLFALCRGLRTLESRITLLSTGLLLPRYAEEVDRWIDEVIVSLDGPPAIHDEIRRIPRAFEKLASGIEAMRAVRADFPVTARSVIQRRNASAIGDTIRAARDLGLDRLSFLAADVSSNAFNRPEGWEQDQTDDVGLDREGIDRFEEALERALVEEKEAFDSGFVAESPAHMRRLVAYFRATIGDGVFPPVRCNAPWTSAVIETDGQIRPCFFHASYGGLGDGTLDEILNSEQAITWRRQLDMARDPICQRCVCTLHVDPWRALR